MIEASIKQKVASRRVAQCPEVANRVDAQERLSEVPYLAKNCQLPAHGMGNCEALTELCSVSGSVDDFVSAWFLFAQTKRPDPRLPDTGTLVERPPRCKDRSASPYV